MLGIDMNDVLVVHGDTAVVQYGIGTFGSRGLAVGGAALSFATEKVVNKARTLAAHLLNTDEASLTFENGRFVGAPNDKSLTIQEVALAAHTAASIPEDFEPGLTATHFFEPKNFTFPSGTHICVVEIDKDTGEIEIKRYIAVDDCGKQINPLLVQGQVHGGIAQGLAQALFEEVVDHTVTPSPVNPLGAKGVGEAGTIGSTPAVANAVIDALAPFGVKHLDLPLRPEKVWRAMNN
jgi:carbon-monoxide dehydrogenase large subunit